MDARCANSDVLPLNRNAPLEDIDVFASRRLSLDHLIEFEVEMARCFRKLSKAIAKVERAIGAWPQDLLEDHLREVDHAIARLQTVRNLMTS